MNARAISPSSYNLLQLYRQHRDEIDTITDQTSLFILAYSNQVGRVDIDSLARDVGLSVIGLRAKMTPLLRGQFMIDNRGILGITAAGKRLLTELGFILPPPIGPQEPPKKPEPPQPTHPRPQSLPERSVATKTVVAPTTTPGWHYGVIGFLSTAVAIVSIIIIILLFNSPTPLPPPTMIAMVHANITADRTLLQLNECTDLHWTTENGEWAEINGERVNLNETIQVCPLQTTTYVLVVGGGGGASDTITIKVLPPTVTPTITPSATPTPTPVDANIYFTADRTTLKLGECTMLRWDVRGGYSVQLDGKQVERSGAMQVCPQQTMTCEITADIGTTMRRSQLIIVVEHPTPTFTWTPTRPPTPTLTRTRTPTPTITRTRTPTPTPTASVDIIGGLIQIIPKVTKKPVNSGTASLYSPNCFDFDQGIMVSALALPWSGTYIYFCPTEADIQWYGDTISPTSNAGLAYPVPQSSAYENCSSAAPIVGGITNYIKGKYYCVYTNGNRTAVFQWNFLQTIDSPHSIKFDWWLY